ncbi:hypothetical protein AAF712_016330 [Marasmius tenuissimus]|uniref:Uncharacterized protein n=1 Tax=Marasmius tenuissimus TaxID=585030 RepID=A0ABR2Z726_9AGAR
MDISHLLDQGGPPPGTTSDFLTLEEAIGSSPPLPSVVSVSFLLTGALHHIRSCLDVRVSPLAFFCCPDGQLFLSIAAIVNASLEFYGDANPYRLPPHLLLPRTFCQLLRGLQSDFLIQSFTEFPCHWPIDGIAAAGNAMSFGTRHAPLLKNTIGFASPLNTQHPATYSFITDANYLFSQRSGWRPQASPSCHYVVVITPPPPALFGPVPFSVVRSPAQVPDTLAVIDAADTDLMVAYMQLPLDQLGAGAPPGLPTLTHLLNVHEGTGWILQAMGALPISSSRSVIDSGRFMLESGAVVRYCDYLTSQSLGWSSPRAFDDKTRLYSWAKAASTKSWNDAFPRQGAFFNAYRRNKYLWTQRALGNRIPPSPTAPGNTPEAQEERDAAFYVQNNMKRFRMVAERDNLLLDWSE